MPLSEAPAITIEEATGSARSILLRGRALPYQGVGFGGEMRVMTTWYPGNPEATIQVLGPELAATSMEGMWKDRFLPGQYILSGFDGLDDLETADALVRAFEALRDSGNELLVQWFNVGRRGVMTSFTPTWVRPQDVRWTAEFTWFATDTRAARAGYSPLPTVDMLTTTVAHDDAVVSVPDTVSKDYLASIVSKVNDVRAQAGQMFDYIRQAQRLVQMPLTLVQGAVSAADSLRAESEDEIGRLTNVPATFAQTTDAVVATFRAETWRRGVARRAGHLVASALTTAANFQRNVLPGALQVLVVPGDTTLRQLSTRYYGSPDSWTVIADANALVDSTVPAGTVLVIPALPTPGAIARF